jgi:hypothetical protein
MKGVKMDADQVDALRAEAITFGVLTTLTALELETDPIALRLAFLFIKAIADGDVLSGPAPTQAELTLQGGPTLPPGTHNLAARGQRVLAEAWCKQKGSQAILANFEDE